MSSQVKVGLTVIFAIVLFYLGLAWVNGSGFWEKERQKFTLLFENVDGLMEGDPVDVRGFVSGRVEHITPGAEAVSVGISLDKEIILHQSATAEIQVKEIMGGKQIAILPGGEGQVLQSGDTLAGSYSLDFSSAFSTVGKVVEGIDGDLIRDFLVRFDSLSAQFGRLAEAVDPQKVEQITDNLVYTTDELRTTFADVKNRNMFGRLDSALAQFSQLATTADASLERINMLSNSLSEKTLPKADSTLDQIYLLLESTDEILSTASELLDKAQNPNSAIGYLLNDPEGGPLLDSTLHNLNRTLDHLRTKKVHVAMSLRHKKRTFDE